MELLENQYAIVDLCYPQTVSNQSNSFHSPKFSLHTIIFQTNGLVILPIEQFPNSWYSIVLQPVGFYSWAE